MSKSTTTPEQPTIIRSHQRSLDFYRHVFGDDFGVTNETVVDLGAGDTNWHNEVELTTHPIRVDMDYVEHPPADLHGAIAANVADGLPFEDESVDRIVSSFMFLHLKKEDAKAAIIDSYRVLKPGGRLQIAPAWKNLGKRNKDQHPLISFERTIDIRGAMTLTKAEGFEDLDDEQLDEMATYMAKRVTQPEPLRRFSSWLMGLSIEGSETHQTIEEEKLAGRNIGRLVLKGMKNRAKRKIGLAS